MKINNIKAGKLGEKLALEALVARGWRLVEKNYWCCVGEVDLIMRKDSEIAFVEVKARTGGWEVAKEALGMQKLAKVEGCAQWYLKKLLVEPEWMIVTVVVDLKTGLVEVLEEMEV